jgi:hypothetical protein
MQQTFAETAQENTRAAANVPAPSLVQKPQPSPEPEVANNPAQSSTMSPEQNSAAPPAAEATEVPDEVSEENEEKGLSELHCNDIAILPNMQTKHLQFDLHFADMVCPWLQSQMQGMAQIWKTTAGLKRCQRLHCWYQSLQAQKARCVMW